MVRANHAIVAVRAHDAFRRIGDEVSGGKRGIPAFHPLRDVVTDTRYTKGESQQTSGFATCSNHLTQLMGMHITEIAIQ